MELHNWLQLDSKAEMLRLTIIWASSEQAEGLKERPFRRRTRVSPLKCEYKVATGKLNEA